MILPMKISFSSVAELSQQKAKVLFKSGSLMGLQLFSLALKLFSLEMTSEDIFARQKVYQILKQADESR